MRLKVFIFTVLFSIGQLFSQDPPTFLSIVEGDEEVSLSWLPPGTTLTYGETCDLPLGGGTITDGFSNTYDSTTTGMENDYVNGTSANGPDVVYRFNVVGNLDVTFSLCDGADWDTYLILLDSDCETILSFDDDGCDGTNGLASTITGTLGSGTYYLIVDGWGTTSSGDFTLTASASATTRLPGGFSDSVTDQEKLDIWDMTGSGITVLSEYTPGIEQTLDFNLNVTSADNEWADGFYLTFPQGWTLSSGTNTQGQPVSVSDNVITFGNPDAASGLGPWGIGDHPFTVTLTPAAAGGNVVVTYYIGGDQWASANPPYFVEGSFTLVQYVPQAGDLMGYNVYMNDTQHNTNLIGTLSYTVGGLTNNTEYTLGVTAAYYVSDTENQESSPVTISGTPTYIYGDVTGTITDVNGNELDSAIVSSSGQVDTTGADGVYTIYNLNTGRQDVMVSRPGFYTTEVEVAVLAQADPTVQNFVLSPDLPNPVALVADAGDEEVLLSWRPPGSEVLYDVSYYDDLFESEIGCNSGGCSWGVRFTPLSYPATLEGLVISIQGNQYSGGNSANAYVEAYLDPSGSVSGPTGDPITLIESTDLVSDMNELVQYSFDVSDVGVTIESGDLYIVVYEPANTTLLIAYDTEPVSSEYFDRNWIYIPDYYDYGWNPISDITTFVGDYGVLATFSGPPPAERSSSSYAVTASGSIVDLPQIIDGPLTNVNNNSEGAIASYSENILDDIYIPRPIPTMNRDGFRDDSLLAYKVYHVTADTTLLVSTTTDTLDTISVDENYVSYCYEVRAQWNTGDAPDGYGILESKPSNTACEIPFAFGDANFDSQTNLTDILAIVDFVLLETVPSDAAFRNSDVNKDGQLNIADIVMVVDIIYADPDASLSAGRLNTSPGLIDLVVDHELSSLKVGLEYSGLLRGMEFSINYDPGFVNLNAPILNKMGENTLLSYNLIEAGLLKIIVADLKGSPINYDQDNFITIPYTFSGNNEQVSEVSIEGVIASGPKGEMINLSYRSSSTDIKLVPGVFALHQNYPNPFNPTTEIRFDLPEASFAEVAIYNLMGHKVKTLFNMNVKAGYHVISWNGTNDKGHMVSTGMYFYTLNTSKYHSMKKMLYLK